VLNRLKASVTRRTGERDQPSDGAHLTDPVTLGHAVGDLVSSRGWTGQVSVASVVAQWEQIVGSAVAAHCHVESFAEATLTIRADSTAWATQLRLLIPQLMTRIADQAGSDAVADVIIHGPGGQSWRHGRLAVPGRGPRDTYG